MRILRAVGALLLLLFLLLAPKPLLRALSDDPMARLFEPEQPDWYGVIEVWHIASFKPFQGSGTKFLREQCQRFQKRHPGVHIEVIGLTPDMFAARIARGAFPDAYSFPAGLLYRERLSAMEPVSLPPLLGNLRAAEADGLLYAVPYLASGNFLLVNEQLAQQIGTEDTEDVGEGVSVAMLQSWLDAGQLCVPPIWGAQLGLVGESRAFSDFLAGKISAAVADARAYGDITRSDSGNLAVRAIPLAGYTDETMYFGAAAGTDATRLALIRELAVFLLSDEVQKTVSTLGALPVRRYIENVAYASDSLSLWQEQNTDALLAPEPFAFERHKDALLQDAERALRGETGAEAAFSERLAVVLNGEN